MIEAMDKIIWRGCLYIEFMIGLLVLLLKMGDVLAGAGLTMLDVVIIVIALGVSCNASRELRKARQ